MTVYKSLALASYDEFEFAVNDAFEKKQPFSFVRLGDGEGALLDFDEKCSIEDIEYLSEHVGKKATIGQLSALKHNLLAAIDNTNIVGIRNDVLGVSFNENLLHQNDEQLFLNEFKQAFTLRATELDICYSDARRIAKLYKAIKHNAYSQQKLCTQWIPFDYFLSGALTNLLERAGEIGVVTARQNIPDKLRKALNIKVVEHITPDKSARQVGTFIPHYPKHFNRIKNEINVKYPGMPYLVAAGLIGKGYCAEIQRQGGIALDIGALIDCWDGRYSRPKVIESKFNVKKTLMGKKKLPEELKMTTENAERLRELFRNTRN
ncbi:hypothetical protein Q4524_03550 [Alteromonas stellipolaris]|uniref:GT-D fold domain-containing protein n=1 Tax=Alteromonas stellipolaris TaxID=233316 RepID=UPI0026E3C1DD|nr:hypothetical protein [Alteromonas stellipolaris]MDO6537652.1 hypothetical protein [Alteromonas stellipolaris]